MNLHRMRLILLLYSLRHTGNPSVVDPEWEKLLQELKKLKLIFEDYPDGKYWPTYNGMRVLKAEWPLVCEKFPEYDGWVKP